MLTSSCQVGCLRHTVNNEAGKHNTQWLETGRWGCQGGGKMENCLGVDEKQPVDCKLEDENMRCYSNVLLHNTVLWQTVISLYLEEKNIQAFKVHL